MRIAEVEILIVPGLGNSGPGHWQRRWAERFPNGRIVEQRNWDHPERSEWIATLVAAIEAATLPVILIGHSLGVMTIIHAAPQLPPGRVRGALLVSPPDEFSPNLPPEAAGFANVSNDPLPFPSIVVASTDDTLVSPERAAQMASAWGSVLDLVANAGHINVASGHGPWPEGLLLLAELMKRV